MNRYRINALVVSNGNKVVGTIARQIVDGAVFHGLGERPIQDYMVTDLPLIDPETPAREILDRMISGRTRFVLVGKSPSNIQGIITRMDLLRFQYEINSPALSLRKSKRQVYQRVVALILLSMAISQSIKTALNLNLTKSVCGQ